MKKRRQYIAILASLFSLPVVACNGGATSSEDMFSTGSSSLAPVINLRDDTRKNYELDESSSNKDGSMSYEIFVRSFYDSNKDGIGDLNGVKQKLPYLASLGIKTLWLMPIFPSPTYHGYDISNYYDINRDYGNMGEFESLVETADEYNIDIMLDMVLNHSSKENPWFEQSYQDYVNNNTSKNSKKDWYNWSNKRSLDYHEYKGKFYEGRFDSSMPDLNWDCDAVRDEIENITKFWISKGVKGFRLDAVLYFYYKNTTRNVEALSWLEETAHKYDPNFYMVGEAWDSNDVVLDYHKSKCDSFFKFKSSINGFDSGTIQGVVKGTNSAKDFASSIENYEKKVKENNKDGYSSYFLSNHDLDRCSYSFSGDYAKAAASLYCLLPGTPFMYYGEEIELKGKRITSPDDCSDARRRLPIIWSELDKTGECKFPERNRESQLGDNEQVKKGVNDQLATPYSLVNHYQKVINVRNKYPMFKHGVFTSAVSLLNTDNKHVLAYKISLNDDYIYVVHNFDSVAVEVTAPGQEILDEINTSRKLPELENGKLRLGAYSTVIVK